MTLPVFTKTMDDSFINTWYEIRDEAIDNILSARVFWLALREYGCLKPQVGGQDITHTIRYGKKTTQNFQKGSVLTQNEVKAETSARWDWRYFQSDVNRSLIDDQKNQGQFKIKDYVAKRIELARDACVEKLDDIAFTFAASQTGVSNPNGLWDAVAPDDAASHNSQNSDTYDSGTSNGGINRSNDWWQNHVNSSSNYAINLTSDMRNFFNTISANQESPNFIICDQELYEAYEDEVADKQQIVRTQFDKTAADLGFQTMTFKGATLAWSGMMDSGADSAADGNEMFMLNMDYLELVYDPNVWFDMTDWRQGVSQHERVAYIVCTTSGIITPQPRRHGYAIWTS